MHFAISLVLAALSATATVAAASSWHKGIVFGLDEWSHPNATGDSAMAASAMAALAYTGADHVRIIFTQYQDFINSTTIYPILPPSPLASATPAAVTAAAAAARSLGLSLTLAPLLDPSWDIPTNIRSSDKPGTVSRLMIGQGFTDAQWAAWFASYTAYVLPWASLASRVGATTFELASELDAAFAWPSNGPRWAALITSIRAVFNGTLTAAFNAGTLASPPAWATAASPAGLDVLGVDAYYDLANASLPLGTAPSVADLQTAWQPIIAKLAAVVQASGKQIMITEVGYESRPSCHVRPWGTPIRDPDDDSAWLCDHDLTCQANAYEALLRSFTAQPWFAGVYWWLWRSDPTDGGSCDAGFTPHGKAAEVVLRRWYGNYSCAADGGYGAAYLAPHDSVAAAMRDAQAWVPVHADGRDAICDGSAAIAAAIQQQQEQAEVRDSLTAAALANLRVNTSKALYNGFVFGGPDEWSSPLYRYDSAGAATSLSHLLAIGADAIEVIAQWYFDNVTSTEVYPIDDPSNALRTSTDEELTVIIQRAHQAGMRVILTPMLDPNWMLPAQQDCRDTSNPGCYWRGQLGIFWGGDCSAGSPWAAWFASYTPFVLHYAKLAASLQVEAFLLAHELEHANSQCPQLWTSLLQQVRSVYGGQVSAAFEPSLLNPSTLQQSPWASDLDFIGIDCYIGLGVPQTALPWQQVPLATLLQAAETKMPAFAALSAATGGKQIVCTEVGWASRPWIWSTWGAIDFLDDEDPSVWSQDVSQEAYTLSVSWFLQTYYAQEWFGGVLFWLWRADPTAGGLSDSGFTAAGKEAIATIKAAWMGA